MKRQFILTISITLAVLFLIVLGVAVYSYITIITEPPPPA